MCGILGRAENEPHMIGRSYSTRGTARIIKWKGRGATGTAGAVAATEGSYERGFGDRRRGLFGLTIAQQAAERAGARVEIIDVRSHIGGNVYSYIDEETGAEIHQYGAHLFHTSTKRVWDYVNRFTAFTDYVHRVYATHDGEVYPLPINLGTINQFFRAAYTPAEARQLIAEQAGELAGTDPTNLNDKGIQLIGLAAV